MKPIVHEPCCRKIGLHVAFAQAEEEVELEWVVPSAVLIDQARTLQGVRSENRAGDRKETIGEKWFQNGGENAFLILSAALIFAVLLCQLRLSLTLGIHDILISRHKVERRITFQETDGRLEKRRLPGVVVVQDREIIFSTFLK